PALAVGGLLWMGGVLTLELLQASGRWALASAVLLATSVPIAANRWIARSYMQEEVFAPPAFARALERRDPKRDFRVLGESHYVAPSPFEASQLSAGVGFLADPPASPPFFPPAPSDPAL